MAMPGRTYAASGSLDDKYRYSHNGQEKDNDIFIGALSAEYWEYDSRTGRRWEIDPILHTWESPYTCFSNNPIVLNDINGAGDKTKEPQSKFDKKHTKKQQRKINRVHRRHERYNNKKDRREERRERREERREKRRNRDSNPNDASAVTVIYENNPGPLDSPPIWNWPGSNKKYYNSDYFQDDDGKSVFRPDEPNNGLKVKGRIFGDETWEVRLMKQKIKTMGDGIHWEAPTSIEFGGGHQFRKSFGKKGNFAIQADLSGTTGITLSSLVDVKGGVESWSIGFPGQNQYSLVAVNTTIGIDLSMVFVRRLIIGVSLKHHGKIGIDVRTTDGNKNIGTYGNNSITLSAGWNFGNRPKQVPRD